MKRLVKGLSICLCFMLMGCVGEKPDQPQPETTDATRFQQEYESLNGTENGSGLPHAELTIDADNPMVYATQQQVETLLTSGTGIVYFGYPECPWCRNTLPVFLEAARDELVTEVYYMNNRDQRDEKELNASGEIVTVKEGSEEYARLLELLGEFASVYDGLQDETVKRLYFPTYVFVNEGKIVAVQVSSLPSVENPRAPLTEQQHDELYEIFRKKIQLTKGACDSAC